MVIINFLIIFIYNIVCMLLVTLIIASLTLIERKVLSLLQRRVGPNVVGYKGRLQYIADALKLFVKGIVVPNGSNKFWFVCIPSIVCAICYTFWLNSMWGSSISILEFEYNLVYASVLSLIFGYCIMLTGYFSRSKYAFMSSIRTGLAMLNLELFLGLFLLTLVSLSESFSFVNFVFYQQQFYFILFYLGVLGLIIIVFLLETNRSPFDLSEAESELVAGYSVEYGGFYFALYYLGEYFHLFFFSMFISLTLLGGWFNLSNFLFYNLYII